MANTKKRPCVALLGEFSAGKSTLANLLLGRRQSPVRVTATQTPPLWYQYGTGDPVRILDDDTAEPLAAGSGSSVPLEDTKFVQVPLDAPILERIDLLDMPGSSDPNMAPDLWDQLLPGVDIAIWCTPATQAWRQSEAAIWDLVPATLQQRSMLLLTRIDKVRAQDQPRVLKRVRDEVAGQFRHVLPAALLTADDGAHSTGPSSIVSALDDLIECAVPQIAQAPERPAPQAPMRSKVPTPDLVAPRRVTTLSAGRTIRRRTAQNALI